MSITQDQFTANKSFQDTLLKMEELKHDIAQQASKQISDRLEQVHKLLSECEDISKKSGVDFSFGGPNSSYGMGGYFADGSWESSSSGC